MSLQIRRTTYRGRAGFSVGAVFCRYRATAAAIAAVQARRSAVPFTPHEAYWRSKLFWDAVLDRLLLAEREPSDADAPVVPLRKRDVPRIGSLPALGGLCDSAKRPLALVSAAGVRPATADMLENAPDGLSFRAPQRLLLPGVLVPVALLRRLLQATPHPRATLDGGNALVIRDGTFRACLWSPESVCWRRSPGNWCYRKLVT